MGQRYVEAHEAGEIVFVILRIATIPDANNAQCPHMPTAKYLRYHQKVHYAYHFSAKPPDRCRCRRKTSVETPFPPFFHVLCLVSPSHALECLLLQIVHFEPRRFFKPASLRPPKFFKVTPDGNDSRTRQMMNRNQTNANNTRNMPPPLPDPASTPPICFNA